MASNINPFNIDGAFPVAGQNNSSQGFRDNFTSIRNNLAIAKSELEDLQAKAVLKSALTGSTLDNNLGGSVINGAQFRAVSDTLFDHGPLLGGLILDYGSANIHKVLTTGDITLSFSSSWPTNSHGRMLLWITVYYSLLSGGIIAPHKLTLPSAVTLGLDRINNLDLTTNTIKFDVPGDYVFEFSTVDGGSNILIKDFVANKRLFNDSSFSYQLTSDNYPNSAKTFFMGFGDSLPVAQSLTANSTKLDKFKIFGSQTNYAGVGDHGNDVPRQGVGTDGNTHVAGYSVATSRAAMTANTGLPDVTIANAAVKSDDYIGFFNFTATTRNPQAISTMTLCEFGAVRGFVSGANTQTPGGNIWIGTKSDGGTIHSSVTIENDQSARFQSNVMLSQTYVSSTIQNSSYWPNDGAGNFLYTAKGTPGQMAWSRNTTNVFFYICYDTNKWMKFTGSTT